MRNDGDWTDYLTKEEHAEYLKEVSNRRWCLERMKDHDMKIQGFRSLGLSRRAEVERSMKEAAE
jgi:hypothetical protein